MKLAAAVLFALNVQILAATPNSLSRGSTATQLAASTSSLTRWSEIDPKHYPKDISCTVQSKDLKTTATRIITRDRLIGATQNLKVRSNCKTEAFGKQTSASQVVDLSCWFEILPIQWPGNPEWKPVYVAYHAKLVKYFLLKGEPNLVQDTVSFSNAMTKEVSPDSAVSECMPMLMR